MIEDGLSYPFRGEWLGRIAIGTLLAFFVWLVIPAILLFGYVIRAMEYTAHGKEEPPEFAEWGSLFVDGIKALIVGFVYSVVPTVLWLLVVTVVFGASLGAGSEQGTGIGVTAMFMTMLMFIPLMFLIAYVLPAAFANMAETGRVGAAFDFGTLKTAWTSADYVIAIVVAFGISIAIGIVSQILAITVVGLLLLPTLNFYTYVAMSRIWARGYAKANGSGSDGRGAAVPTA